jgi:uncharacterized phage-associated protein
MSPIAVANAFLKVADDHNRPLANMQLQKLVYFAHGWHLALKGEALIDTPLLAWNFGPVIPPLYNSLKKFGAGPVSGPIVKNAEASKSSEKIFKDEFLKRLIDRV